MLDIYLFIFFKFTQSYKMFSCFFLAYFFCIKLNIHNTSRKNKQTYTSNNHKKNRTKLIISFFFKSSDKFSTSFLNVLKLWSWVSRAFGELLVTGVINKISDKPAGTESRLTIYYLHQTHLSHSSQHCRLLVPADLPEGSKPPCEGSVASEALSVSKM